jgi:hypothetical protein
VSAQLVDFRRLVFPRAHFRWAELVPPECRAGAEPWMLGNLKALVHTIVEPIRRRLCHPIVISPHGGLRLPEFNKRWGGATHSIHTLGGALDLTPKGQDPDRVEQIVEIAKTLNPWQIIVYPTFVHVAIGVSTHPKHAARYWADHRGPRKVRLAA